MPAGDINTYALAIEFNLTDKASPVLDQVDARLQAIESRVNDIGFKSMNQLKDVAAQLGSNLSAMVTQQDKLNSLVGVSTKPMRESADLSGKSYKMTQDESKLLKDQFLKNWDDITHKLSEKQLLLDKEVRTLRDEEQLLGALGSLTKIFRDQIKQAADAVTNFATGWFDIIGAIKQAIKDAEAFHTANFRIYGTMDELVGRTADLAQQTGILRSEIVEAYTELVNVRAPKDALDSLSETATRFGRITGVNTKTTAEFTRMLLNTGATAKDVTVMTEYMAQAQRKFGLSTSDLSALMKQNTDGAAKYAATWGIDAVEGMNKASIHLASLGKQFGLSTEQITTLNAEFQKIDPKQWMKMGGVIGALPGELDTVEGRMRAMFRYTEHMEDQIAKAGGRTKLEGAVIADELNKVYRQLGFQNTEALQMAAQQAKKSGKSITEEYDKIVKEYEKGGDAQARMKKLYDETIGVQRAAAEATSAFMNAWTKMWVAIAPAVTKVLEVITVLVNKLGTFGTIITGLGLLIGFFVLKMVFMRAMGTAVGKMFEGLFSGIGRGLDQLKGKIGTLLGLALGLVLVSAAVYIFAQAVALVAKHGRGGVEVALGLAAAMSIMAFALAGAAKISQDSLIPILAISVGLILMATAVYIFALAVAMLAEIGSDAFFMMLGMVGAFLIVITVIAILVALMTAFPPAVIVLLAFAVAMILLAVAALILAYAIRMTTDAFIDFVPNVKRFIDIFIKGVSPAEAMSFLMVVGILVVGLVLLAAAGALAVAAGPILMAGAVAMVAAAVMFIVLAALMQVGMTMLVESADGLAYISDVFSKYAGPLVGAGADLLQAGALLMAAAAPLGVAGVAMRFAVGRLVGAAEILGDIGPPFALGSRQILSGALALRTLNDVLSGAGTSVKGAAEDFKIGFNSLNAAFKSLPALAAQVEGVRAMFLSLSGAFQAADSLAVQANKISAITVAFQSLRAALGEPILLGDFADKLEITLASILNVLVQYASAIEGAVDTIVRSLSRLALGSMVAKLTTNLVSAAPIASVQTRQGVMPGSDDSEFKRRMLSSQGSIVAILAAIRDTMMQKNDKANNEGGGGPEEDLAAIVTLLRTHLPDMASAGFMSSPVGGQMRKWGS